MTLHTFRDIPPIQIGYPLDFGERGQWYVLRPRAATNLATNPSIETNTTGYTAVLSTMGRVSVAFSDGETRQRRGAFSLEARADPLFLPDWGFYYSGFSLTAGTLYFISFDFIGDPGVTYETYIANTSGGRLSALHTFTATGLWQRVSFSWQANASGTHRLYLTQPLGATVTSEFHFDGLQIEATRLTEYFDGDSVGFVVGRSDFYWTGTPHGSTSVRIAQARAGGERVSLKDLGFRVMAMVGGGLSGIVNQLTPLALGGAFYEDTIYAARGLTLVGSLMAASQRELISQRDALIRLLAPDATSPPQPFLLVYDPRDECGRRAGEEQEIKAVFQSGLEGRLDSVNQERFALAFTLPDRYGARAAGERGAEMTIESVSTNRIITRNGAGDWTALGTGLNDIPFAAARGQDGKIYIVGQFTAAGGVAGTRGIARWTGTAWEAVGSGLDNGSAFAIVVGPDGSIYIGGNFTSVSGVAATDNLARWNGSSWVSISASITGTTVDSLAMDGLGRLYAGGDFTDIDGVANTARIAYRTTGGTWTAMGTGGSSGTVQAIAVMPSGDIVAGGSFALMGGVASTVRIARWDGAAWNAMGTGANGLVDVFAVTAAGVLYAGGQFTTMNGVTVNYVAAWNGTAWAALASGVSDFVRGMALDGDGLLHVVGDFLLASGESLMQYYTIWNGAAWLPPDIYPNATYYSIFIDTLTDSLYLLWSSTGGQGTAQTLRSDNNSLVDYKGTFPIGPKVKITGPGTLHQVRNYTTGQTIYFNVTLNAGEIAVLDLSDQTRITFESNFRDLLSEIKPGSDMTLKMLPGDNALSVFIPVNTDGNTEIALVWRDAHHALDAAQTTNFLGN